MSKVCATPGHFELAVPGGSYCEKCRKERQRKKKYQRSEAGMRGQKWKSSKRWKRKRDEYLASQPFCECPEHRGQRLRADDPRFGGIAVVDHVVPHRGDYARFWHGRLQTLTKYCHDTWAQRKDRRYDERKR